MSGAAWFNERRREQELALAFVRRIFALPVPRLCLENPVSIISSRVRKPDQIIQPWQFGHAESKKTCLWLKGLPKLNHTDLVRSNGFVVGRSEAPSPDRWKKRSKTFSGIAEAMADQWGDLR